MCLVFDSTSVGFHIYQWWNWRFSLVGGIPLIHKYPQVVMATLLWGNCRHFPDNKYKNYSLFPKSGRLKFNTIGEVLSVTHAACVHSIHGHYSRSVAPTIYWRPLYMLVYFYNRVRYDWDDLCIFIPSLLHVYIIPLFAQHCLHTFWCAIDPYIF